MHWFVQNWIWILLAVGLFFLMRRGGCGMGGGMKGHENHGGDGGNMSHDHADENQSAGTVIDPINKAVLDVETALTSAYNGKIYYFGSVENQAAFELDPDQYSSAEKIDLQPQRKRHHGC